MRGAILTAAAAVIALNAACAAHAIEPCTESTASCTEWVAPSGAKERLLVYRTFALDVPNNGIVGGLVVVHGLGRNAESYFRSAIAAASLAGVLDRTLIVTPRFAANDGKACKDALAAGELNWACRRTNNWRTGGTAVNDAAVTSFDLADELVRKLSLREIFPNLRSIVIAGHSAGGQFVTRYAFANGVHERAAVPLAYVVANPSSYAYLDDYRPTAAGGFSLFPGAAACPHYNRWHYGLAERSGYAARIDDDELKKRFAARAVTYLLGERDTLQGGDLDMSCGAMAQGPNRFARGNAYAEYAIQRFQAPHRAVVIPLCGHNARCMFTAERALPVLFPLR